MLANYKILFKMEEDRFICWKEYYPPNYIFTRYRPNHSLKASAMLFARDTREESDDRLFVPMILPAPAS